MRRIRSLGVALLLAALLALSGLAGPSGLPACVHQETADGSLHWQCTGEGLLGELATTLTIFAKHLTAVLRNPPKDIQLLLYNYKQESLELPLSKAYRFYKEQLMLPTEEILNPWDWSFGGDGPIFFIDRQSPETVYFLEAPKKNPDCEVDWWLFWGELKSYGRHIYFPPPQIFFTEDAPITQSIKQCYFLPSNTNLWEFLTTFMNDFIVDRSERYYDMNPTARNRLIYLPERNMDVTVEGNRWLIAFETVNYLDKQNWLKIFGTKAKGAGIIVTQDITWEEMNENTKTVVGTINIPSYTSEFPFEPYIKTNATLWRPQELGVDLGPDLDYLRPWPFIDIPVQVELIEPVDWERLKREFQERYGAELGGLRRELQDFGADPAVLDIDNWQFGVVELEPGSYTVAVDGTIRLTDPTQPASAAEFQKIAVSCRSAERP